MEIAALVISIVMPLIVFGLGWWKTYSINKKSKEDRAILEERLQEFKKEYLATQEESKNEIKNVADSVSNVAEEYKSQSKALNELVKSAQDKINTVTINNISGFKVLIDSEEETSLIKSVSRTKGKIPIAESRSRMNKNKATKKKKRRKPKRSKNYGKMK